MSLAVFLFKFIKSQMCVEIIQALNKFMYKNIWGKM